MKAIVYRGPKQLVCEDMEIPIPAEKELLIRVDIAGICGSEMEGYLGLSSIRVAPLVMGHEFCGRVEAFGTAVSGFAIGEKVVVNPLVHGQEVRKAGYHRTQRRSRISAKRCRLAGGRMASYLGCKSDERLFTRQVWHSAYDCRRRQRNR